MTPLTADTLRALIAQGESETLEFKRSTAATKAIRTVAALANTRGGHVVIGVAPDGRIIGQDIGQDTMDKVANEVTGNTDPKLYPSVKTFTLDERSLIVISVKESDDKPHLAYNMAYKRVGATTVQMQRAEYERLLLQRRQLRYDQRGNPEATLNDIDEARLRWYLEQAAQERGIPVDTALPIMENLRRLEVVNEREGRSVLTTAAVLVFGKHPQRFAPQSKVRLARFQGSLPLNFIDRLDCAGTLPEMIDEAERFIRRNTRVAAKVTGFERREITEYPTRPCVRRSPMRWRTATTIAPMLKYACRSSTTASRCRSPAGCRRR
jgi:ATP-dependent DNA helicase RecG